MLSSTSEWEIVKQIKCINLGPQHILFDYKNTSTYTANMNRLEDEGFWLSSTARGELEKMRDDLSDEQYASVKRRMEQMGAHDAYDEGLTAQMLQGALGKRLIHFMAEPEIVDTIQLLGRKYTMTSVGMNTLTFGTFLSAVVESPIWTPQAGDIYDIEAMKRFLTGSTFTDFDLANRRIRIVLSGDIGKVLEGDLLAVIQESAEEYALARVEPIPEA